MTAWWPFAALFVLLSVARTIVLVNAAPEVDDYSSMSCLASDLFPSMEDWPHYPVLLRSGEHVRVENYTRHLPLGIPFNFETDLFIGKALMRIQNVRSDDQQMHDQYFRRRRSRTFQLVVQGNFKEALKMSDVFFGSTLEKPLLHRPPWLILKTINWVIKQAAPGLIFDLTSKTPRVMAMYIWSAEDISIDNTGEEPSITGAQLPNNVTNQFGDEYNTRSMRFEGLSSPKVASKYEFSKDFVYTFHTYDGGIDYSNFTFPLPKIGTYNLSKALGKQPLSFTAATAKGNVVFSFDLWHESLMH